MAGNGEGGVTRRDDFALEGTKGRGHFQGQWWCGKEAGGHWREAVASLIEGALQRYQRCRVGTASAHIATYLKRLL